MLTGAPNFRDLGGYSIDGVHQVRRGQVYRSSQLSRLTADDIETVGNLRLAATIDFRSARERTAQPTPQAVRTEFEFVSSKDDTDFIFNKIFAKSERTASAWSDSFAQFYASMLNDYAAEFVAMFQAIADSQVPILIHCSAGKDRTGAASALVLDLLGVDRSQILDDYLRSSALLDTDHHFENMLSDAKLDVYAGLPLECRRVMLGTDRAYLNGLFAALDEHYRSTEGYLRHHGLTDRQLSHIRDHLIDCS
jgi:protein-tyrosine phosphatase